MTPTEEQEILKVLNSVGVTLTAKPQHGESFSDFYCGNYTWRLSNGWRVTVFNDCDEWDYIDNIETSDGRVWVYPDGEEHGCSELSLEAADWRPTNVLAVAWGVNGAQFRVGDTVMVNRRIGDQITGDMGIITRISPKAVWGCNVPESAHVNIATVVFSHNFDGHKHPHSRDDVQFSEMKLVSKGSQ